MSRRNAQLAAEIASYLKVDAAAVEKAIAPFLIVRFDRLDVHGLARDRGIELSDEQIEAVMDTVARRFDPDGEGLTWRAIDAAIDEVTGRS
jgi:hypothetical protein